MAEMFPVNLEDGTGGRIVAKNSCCRNYAGIFLALGSSFMFTLGGVIVKYMKDYHPMTLAVYRFQGMLFSALGLALYFHHVKKKEVLKGIWPLKDNLKTFLLNCLRGVLGGIALILLYYSIQRLSLADAIVINSCRPVFVTFGAYIFLGEPCGVFPVFAAMLTIVGVGVISRPPILTGEEDFSSENIIGVGLAFTGMLVAAMNLIMLRYLRRLHVSIIVLAFGFWGAVVSGVGSGVVGRFDLPSSIGHLALAICLGAVLFGSQMSMSVALKHEQAAPVSIVRSCDSVFAFLLQFAVLGVVPDWYSATGAILIIFCVLMIAFRKWVSTLPDEHSARSRYWFVLK